MCFVWFQPPLGSAGRALSLCLALISAPEEKSAYSVSPQGAQGLGGGGGAGRSASPPGLGAQRNRPWPHLAGKFCVAWTSNQMDGLSRLPTGCLKCQGLPGGGHSFSDGGLLPP